MWLSVANSILTVLSRSSIHQTFETGSRKGEMEHLPTFRMVGGGGTEPSSDMVKSQPG